MWSWMLWRWLPNMSFQTSRKGGLFLSLYSYVKK
jgi:hypothetical protein